MHLFDVFKLLLRIVFLNIKIRYFGFLKKKTTYFFETYVFLYYLCVFII